MTKGDIMINDGATIGLENIDTQINDPVVNALANTFGRIRSILMGRGGSGKNNRKVRGFYNVIDNILADRFGITFRHAHKTGTPYAVVPIAPSTNNVLAGDLTNQLDKLRDMYGEGSTEGGSYRTVYDADRQMRAIVTEISRSVDELDDAMNNDGVLFDYARAKVTGLPKDMVVFLVSDVDLLMKDLELSDMQCVAILLHEVGHAWTHMAYSYRVYRNTSVLLDSVKIDSSVDSKAFEKRIRVVYSDLGGEKKGGKVDEVLLELPPLILRNSYGDNLHSYTDSEQLADQFSTRFGVGGYLSSALVTLNAKNSELTRRIMLDSYLYAYVMTVLYVTILTASLLFALVMTTVFVMYQVIFQYVLLRIMGSFHTPENNKNVYDDTRRRFRRVRNDMVRQLRGGDIPDKYLAAHIDSLDILAGIINDTKQHETGFGSSLLRKMFKHIDSRVSSTNIEKQLEDLMENELHVEANRLKIVNK